MKENRKRFADISIFHKDAKSHIDNRLISSNVLLKKTCIDILVLSWNVFINDTIVRDRELNKFSEFV